MAIGSVLYSSYIHTVLACHVWERGAPGASHRGNTGEGHQRVTRDTPERGWWQWRWQWRWRCQWLWQCRKGDTIGAPEGDQGYARASAGSGLAGKGAPGVCQGITRGMPADNQGYARGSVAMAVAVRERGHRVHTASPFSPPLGGRDGIHPVTPRPLPLYRKSSPSPAPPAYPWHTEVDLASVCPLVPCPHPHLHLCRRSP